MKKTVIGIAANDIEDSGNKLYHLPIVYIPAGYVKGVQLSGGLPILLPIGPKESAKTYVDMIDKLILTGGQNVHPKFYNEKTMFDEKLAHTKRDEFEMALIKETIKQKKPIFGVCRGLQLLNVSLGGSLHQDLSKRAGETVKHMQDPIPRQIPTHAITTKPKSLLREIYSKKANVNSFHFQAIKEVAPSLQTTAYSEDGIIEGVESIDPNNRWLGVQWHPDFSYKEQEQERKMFDFVVNNL